MKGWWLSGVTRKSVDIVAQLLALGVLFLLAVGGISLLAAGCGFWWAWIDRERLTWHDRISRTRMIRETKQPAK